MKKFALMAVVLMLTACNQSAFSGSGCGWARDCQAEEIQQDMHACTVLNKKWVDKMACKRRVGMAHPSDPLDNEISAYIGVLIEKVKTHKMTVAQAEYAYQQKVAEVSQRLDQANAENRRLNLIERQQDMQAAQERARRLDQINQENDNRLLNSMKPTQPLTTTYTSPTTTHCSPDGYGGVTCTTN